MICHTDRKYTNRRRHWSSCIFYTAYQTVELNCTTRCHSVTLNLCNFFYCDEMSWGWSCASSEQTQETPSSPMLHSRNVIGLFRCEVSQIEILCVKVTPNLDKSIVNIICDSENCSCARQCDSNAVNRNLYGIWMFEYFSCFYYDKHLSDFFEHILLLKQH